MTFFLPSLWLSQVTAKTYSLRALEFFLSQSNKMVFELPFETILKIHLLVRVRAIPRFPGKHKRERIPNEPLLAG